MTCICHLVECTSTMTNNRKHWLNTELYNPKHLRSTELDYVVSEAPTKMPSLKISKTHMICLQLCVEGRYPINEMFIPKNYLPYGDLVNHQNFSPWDFQAVSNWQQWCDVPALMLIVLYTSMQYYYHSIWLDAFVDFSIKLCHESILNTFVS